MRTNENRGVTRRFIWLYARPHAPALVFAIFLNSMSGFAMTLQTMAPKYLIDDVIMATSLTNTERYIRLAWLTVAYLFISVVCRMLGWHASLRASAKT